MGLQFFVCLFLFPFGAYAEETAENASEIFEDTDIVAYASDDVIAAMHYETMNALADLKQHVTNVYRNYISPSLTSLKEQIFTRIDDTSSELQSYIHSELVAIYSNNISPSLTNLKNSVIKDVNEHTTSIYGQYIAPSLTSLKEQVNAHIDEVFGTLKTAVQQGSSDIQNNANQNTDKVLNEGSDKPAYEFDSGLTDVLIKLDEYCTSLDDTLLQINNASSAVSEYLTTGTEMIESTLGVFPSIFTALITFGIVFVFARKVVGR